MGHEARLWWDELCPALPQFPVSNLQSLGPAGLGVSECRGCHVTPHPAGCTAEPCLGPSFTFCFLPSTRASRGAPSGAGRTRHWDVL